MLYSVPGCKRISVRSSACCWERRIGMRAGATARIDGSHHPSKGRVEEIGRDGSFGLCQSIGARVSNPRNPAASNTAGVIFLGEGRAWLGRRGRFVVRAGRVTVPA
jgi:hypothetical protein